MPQNKVTDNQPIVNKYIVNMDFSSLYATTIINHLIRPINTLRIRKIKKLFNL